MILSEQWYMIPGFRCYEINIDTLDVRSLKHYKSDPFHIMKVDEHSGNVRIVDDYGKPTRISPEELYDITFNRGYELKPRGSEEIWKGGMSKVARNMNGNINILTGNISPIAQPREEAYVIDLIGAMTGTSASPIKKFIKPFNIKID